MKKRRRYGVGHQMLINRRKNEKIIDSRRLKALIRRANDRKKEMLPVRKDQDSDGATQLIPEIFF